MLTTHPTLSQKLHDCDLVLVEREAELRRLKLAHENTLAELHDAVTKKESSLMEVNHMPKFAPYTHYHAIPLLAYM